MIAVVPTVVRSDDGLEGLLPSRIPNHGLHGLATAAEDLTSKFYTKSGFIVAIEFAFGELQEKAALANTYVAILYTWIAHDDVLEEIVEVVMHNISAIHEERKQHTEIKSRRLSDVD